MIPQDEDIVERGLVRLASQFQDKPVIESFLKVYLEKLEEVEQGFLQLLNERGISSAIGNQLDLIGKIVGESRLGRDDETYRSALYLRIFINNSEGTPEDVLSALKLITQATYVNMWEHYPASVHLLTNGTSIPDNLAETLKNVVPAAVSLPRIILDPYEDTFIPCELDDPQDRGILTELSGAEVGFGFLIYNELSDSGAITFNESSGNSGIIQVDYVENTGPIVNPHGICAELVV